MAKQETSGISGQPLLKRRQFLEFTAAASAGFLAKGLAAQDPAVTPRKPNIVLIVADDLGNADLGCQGGMEIPTPHIDSIAHNGVLFTSGYVSCPVCSPTRAGLMTGRYQQRFGHEFNPDPDRNDADTGELFGLSLNEKTMADLLKAHGYVTGIMGKWHLGKETGFHPLQRGFDEFYGFLGGSHHYLEPSERGKEPILRGFEILQEDAYLTNAITREAAAYIERHQASPFFLYLTYNAVHTPLEAPSKYLDRFSNITDKKHRAYAAMLSAMDDGVGEVLTKLRQAGLEQDTLVFFISDNGGPEPMNTSNNGRLRATKGTVYEGGIRVPFLLQWPGKLPGGTVYHSPVISLDILTTALVAAGGHLPKDPPLDGVDLLPFVRKEKTGIPHESLCWRMGVRRAIRKGDWKLVQIGEKPVELYNLASDIGEETNRAASNPTVVAELETVYKGWEANMVPPRWKGARKRPQWQDEAEGRQERKQRKAK